MSLRVPRHIAVIMDGNGRWAEARGLPREDGHREGVLSVSELVEVALAHGVEVLTLYSFSTENWKRPIREVKALMALLQRYVKNERERILTQKIRFRIIGERERLPRVIARAVSELEKVSSRYEPEMTLNIAVSYGGRQEITQAVREVATRVASGELTPDAVNEDLISSLLYTAGQPDPDLVIRTSGELRLSNFLLWQVAYSEIYVTETLWPDFRRAEFERALQAYQDRSRRFGAL